MLKVLSYILCDLDPKVKVIAQKAGICDGVPSTSALVLFMSCLWFVIVVFPNHTLILFFVFVMLSCLFIAAL